MTQQQFIAQIDLIEVELDSIEMPIKEKKNKTMRELIWK